MKVLLAVLAVSMVSIGAQAGGLNTQCLNVDTEVKRLAGEDGTYAMAMRDVKVKLQASIENADVDAETMASQIRDTNCLVEFVRQGPPASIYTFEFRERALSNEKYVLSFADIHDSRVENLIRINSENIAFALTNF